MQGVKAHLWKCQLEEGKHASVRELSTIVDTACDKHSTL